MVKAVVNGRAIWETGRSDVAMAGTMWMVEGAIVGMEGAESEKQQEEDGEERARRAPACEQQVLYRSCPFAFWPMPGSEHAARRWCPLRRPTAHAHGMRVTMSVV